MIYIHVGTFLRSDVFVGVDYLYVRSSQTMQRRDKKTGILFSGPNGMDLAAFMQRLTVTHVTRWQKHRRRVGEGHVYQRRFKSFPVEADYFYQVVRYVERNALRANLVDRAEEWQWSSLWRRRHGTIDQRRWLGAWPLPRPRHWLKLVNESQAQAELESLRRSRKRGQPFGSQAWIEATAKQMNLQSTLRARGRPKKSTLPHS